MKLNESQKPIDKRKTTKVMRHGRKEERGRTDKNKKGEVESEMRDRFAMHLDSDQFPEFSSAVSSVFSCSNSVSLHFMRETEIVMRTIKLASIHRCFIVPLPLYRSPSMYDMQQLSIDCLPMCIIRGTTGTTDTES